MTNLDSILKSRERHYFADKGPSSQSYGFSSGRVWMWELDYKENWVLKNWCFWTVVLEKTLESPLDSKEIQPVHSKGNQSWIFIGRTDVEVQTPILWPLDVKNWLIRKDPDAGKHWTWEEKGTIEDEMVGWGASQVAPVVKNLLASVGEGWMESLTQWTWVLSKLWELVMGQRGLAYCSPRGHKELGLDWTESKWYIF